jgi:hypothetical protein
MTMRIGTGRLRSARCGVRGRDRTNFVRSLRFEVTVWRIRHSRR